MNPFRLSSSGSSSSRSFLGFKIATLGVLSWSLFASAALAVDPIPSASDSGVIARIGDTEVKVDDIRASIASLDARELAALARDPGLLNQVVRTFLVRRIVLKEALAKKWDQESDVAVQIQRARDNTIVETYLQSVSKPADTYPSDAEVQSAYESKKPQLLVPRQFRLAQIFIAVPRTADKATTDKAQNKLEAVKKSLHQTGADFAAIAKANSEESESASRGGEIGWLAENQVQPEVRPQVTSLSKNATSEPIRLEDGWHILKVLDIKEAYTPTLDEIRSQLVQQLRSERTQSNTQAYLARLLQQSPVAINELALSKVLKPEK